MDNDNTQDVYIDNNPIDCTFDTVQGRFNYRVGAIIIDQGNILMVKNKSIPYYYSVGGRVQVNETSRQAVLREVYEETGVQFGIDRLGFVYENFSVNKYKNFKFHGISLYYYMNNPNTWVNLKDEFRDVDVNDNVTSHILRWIPLDKIGSFNLVPKFFKTELFDPTSTVKHIIDISN
ncbi:MAG: NUDIX domain-containing protein [Clostridiales bacterium]|jgi:ADP-ribose pyrophosphatase YjhB (NUDIX family)|nr:NUDIX domain-containing protein [Clostridiales bacterium]